MHDHMPPDMIEAMRLTRAGRLADATTLLQRLLRDERPDPSSGPARGEDLPVVDLQPVMAGATDAKALTGPAQSERREGPASGAFASLPSAWQARAPRAIRTGLGEPLRGPAARVVPAGGEPWTGPSPTPG